MSKALDSLPPKTAFTLGLVGGVLGLFTIGFFVLLGTLASGGQLRLARSSNPPAATSATNPSSSAQPPLPTAPSRPPTREAGTPPPVTDKDHVRGEANAKLTLIEYSDFECPFCKRFHPTMQQVLDEYAGRVRWVYRHFPLSFHANAQKEAEASECAGELGGNDAFWRYSDAIFERTTSNGTGFPLDGLVPLAKELGLSEAPFKECLDTDRYAQYVRDQMNAGAAAGVTGTPGTFVVNADGEADLIPGALPFESVKQVIESLL